MNKQALIDLKARVDAATGPDREIDALVAQLVAGRPSNWVGYQLPPYTSSIDKVVRLIELELPGCSVRLQWGAKNAFGDPLRSSAEILASFDGQFGLTFRRSASELAHTPALALLSALLAALIAEGKADGV